MPYRSRRCLSLVVITALLYVLWPGQMSATESDWYLAARLGEADSDGRLGFVHPKSLDDDVSSVAVGAGYVVNRYLAIEAGYHDLGGHRGFGSPCAQRDDACIERLATLGLCAEGFECTEILVALEAKITGFSLALVPGWPVTDRFTVFGKAGVVSWDASVSATSFGQIETLSGEDLVTGVGLRYDFSSGLGLLIEYEEMELGVVSTALGLRWRF